VVVGPRQPAAVHALAQAINAALGNVGATVFHHAPMVHDVAYGPAALKVLIDEMKAGHVDTLVITARNPAYTAPADLGFADALRGVKNVVYTSLYEDETSALAGSFVPALHDFESWGDARATDGTVSIVQPLIAPLYVGMTAAELVSGFLGEARRGGYDLTKSYWKARKSGGPDFDLVWDRWLRDGVIPETAAAVETPTVAAEAGAAGLPAAMAPGGATEVLFAACPKLFDGRFANSAWLQELPDPVTKITWDNAVLISPSMAERLGVKPPSDGTLLNRPGMSDVVSVEVGGRKIEGPAYIAPGMADETAVLVLGYGRKGAAESTAHEIGYDAGSLRSAGALWLTSGNVAATGGRHQLAITQDHWRMEGRELAIEVDARAFAAGAHPGGHGEQGAGEHGGAGHEEGEGASGMHALEANRGDQPTLHKKWDPNRDDLTGRKVEYQWGMAIDLNKCTGCNACVVACQSENNIATVGKHNVVRAREMQWIRIDRYFTGDEHDPEVVNQPSACLHCEAAPCEYVCPVNATVHSDEGLNEMVYNRCVGTRYCLNNCPYKARRFNFLHYHGDLDPVSKMRMNPDVTVRSRGVMEKCTYCVQRIERKRIDARIAGHVMEDGDVVSACQQTCPSDAIVFGNINDPVSRVSKLYNDRRRYDLLHELNTRPRTVHLARVRNPNPELG